MNKNTKKIVQEANIKYHTALAESYDYTQPQFKQENVTQVNDRLKQLALKTKGKRLLDIGCGTGFILSIAAPYFEELQGIDITKAMLNQARIKFKKNNINNVHIDLASSEKIPFPDKYFDLVTAYGFLHHLSSLEPTLKEVYRVLKKDGVFYVDQEPNFYYWQSMKHLSSHLKDLSELLEIERKSVCNMVGEVQSVVGNHLESEIIKMAEFQKTKGGIKEENIVKLLKKVGFKNIKYEYTWYWQQGRIIHDLSLETALYFEQHLRAALPLTKGFFKYVRIEAIA